MRKTHADKVERWAIDRLIPYAKNARTHSDAQIAAIAASSALNDHAIRSPKRKPMLIRERNTLVGTATRLGDVAGENRLHADVPKRIGERVGMSKFGHR